MSQFTQWVKRAFTSKEKRAVYPWNVYGEESTGAKTTSGTNVSEVTALKYSVVYAAVTLIADGISSLPPVAYQELEDGTRKAGNLPQWIKKPHPEMRRFDVWNQIMIGVLLWGNGLAQFIRRQSDGVIIGMNVLDPSTVEIEWDPNKPGYRRYRIGGNGQWLGSYDIFHIQGPTLPGKPKGMSVISAARESIGLGLTLEEFGARYFAQGSQAKIVIELPGTVPDENKAKSIIRTFERFHRGKDNWHRPAIASGGAKIHNISISPEDAQFLESREFEAVDVARWFRVPPHRVGIVSASTSWGSGLAEENMAMLQHTYNPWIIRFKSALTDYAPGLGEAGTIIELLTDELMRGTYKELADVWTSLYEKDIATKDETRKKLGLPKVDGGDKFFSESQAANAPAPVQPQATADPRTKEEDKIRKQEEAKRDDAFVRMVNLLESRFNKEHDGHTGKFASHGSSAGTGGMSPATDEKRQEYKMKTGQSIPPAWKEVEIADDLDNSALLVRGKDGKGRTQSRYSAAHTKAQSEKKFARNKELAKHTDKLDSALERDHLDNDDAGSLLLIRKMGLRPGSDKDTGARVQAHGATNLKAKHVKIDKNGDVHLDFIGKEGVHIQLAVKDKQVSETLRRRIEGKSANDRIFDTNEQRIRDYMRGEGGVPQEFLVKDLRTLHANTTALKAMQSIPHPKTKREFQAARKRVAEQVSAQLGNTPTLALNSYINPAIFDKWVLDGSWL